jgi:coenzyme F420-reducing hydrogenase beta subunit
MTEICDKEKCTGCFGCLNICKKNAISMEADSLGFAYPVINTSLCIDCDLCKNHCPVNKPLFRQKAALAIAAYSSSEKDRASSTSGGAASIFSHYTIEQQGIVYGCSGKNATTVRHIRVSSAEDLPKLKGSKYVQSEVGSCFKDVQNDLQANKQVLFIGTPCQIAGLKNFLQKDWDNLITIDLVCHGVPSQQLLNENIKNQNINNIKSIQFRKKGIEKSQQKYGIYLSSSNEKNLFSEDFPKNDYMTGFMYGLFHRESCYSCTYANIERCSDITLGDFWGFQGFDDFPVNHYEGLSLILPSSEKGRLLFEACKSKLHWTIRPVEEAERGNGQLQKPSQKNKNHDLFKELYPQKGFHQSCKICLRENRIIHKKQKRKNAIRFFISKIPFAKSIYKFIKGK